MNWVTNDSKAAKALRKADRRYASAREAAKNLPLAEKIEALRKAHADKLAAYASAAQ